jgi:hypothetical protein
MEKKKKILIIMIRNQRKMNLKGMKLEINIKLCSPCSCNGYMLVYTLRGRPLVKSPDAPKFLLDKVLNRIVNINIYR